MNKKSLRLLSRFALSANCPANVDRLILERCAADGSYQDVEEELKKYRYLYSHLRLLAEILGKPEFSYKVAATYIFGNRRINATTRHYERLLEIFAEQGVTEDRLVFLRENRPPIFRPNHLQHVLMDVRSLGLTDELAKKAIRNCMVRPEQREEGKVATHWGVVIAILTGSEAAELENSIKLEPSLELL